MKGYLLCAGIVRLCYQEPHGVKNAMERYEDVDPTVGSRAPWCSGGFSGQQPGGWPPDAVPAALQSRSMSRLDRGRPRCCSGRRRTLAKAVEEEEDDLT